jgi:hypothetical protein
VKLSNQNVADTEAKETKSYWDEIKDEEEVIVFNNVVAGFLVPPEDGYIMEGLNAVTYAVEAPSKLFKDRRCLPDEIEANDDLTKEKMDDNYPCKIVQISNVQQYVVVDDLAFRITGVNINAHNEKIFELRIRIALKEVEDQNELDNIRDIVQA